MIAEQLDGALNRWATTSIAVIGCAGGNGLDKVAGRTVERVVAVDVNPDYIEQTRARYAQRLLGLELVCADAQSESLFYGAVDFTYAALLFEYVGALSTLKTLKRSSRPSAVVGWIPITRLGLSREIRYTAGDLRTTADLRGTVALVGVAMDTRSFDFGRTAAQTMARTGMNWRATLVAGAALCLAACGGSAAPTPTSTPPMPAPSGLAYPSPGTMTVGTDITPLTPSVSGTVTSYSVSPAMPPGLTLNTTTGVISGTPTAATPSTSYVVQAMNSRGSTTYTIQFAVGTVDVLSESNINRTVVAGTSIYVDVVIEPRYMSFTGTLYSEASDPNGVFAEPVSVTSNADGSFTLEFATSNTATAGLYTGTATLLLCGDSSCATPQPVASVSANYSIQVLGPDPNWPGNHLTTLTPWSGVADWQTFQGNSAHTGFVPATISPDQLVTRWQQGVAMNVYFNGTVNLATVTTSDGLFYIAGGNQLQARRESDAGLVWSYDFSGLQFPSVNPPAVSNGVVYIAAGQQSSTYMFAFDAATGALIFKAPMSSQWENYLAPTIGPDGVYTNAGTYGGIYGFSVAGNQLFFTGLAQQSAWTPAVDSTTVYAYTGDSLTLIDPVSGRITATIIDPTFTNYIYVIGGAVVLGASHSAFAAAYDNSFVIGAGNYLLHFNTASLTIDWNVRGDYPETPAYNAGVVYAVNDDPVQLEARSETDGSLLWSWSPPAAGDVAFKSEVLLTNNLVFVSTNLSTYAVDLTTHKAVWSYPTSGNLALSSDGVLYLEGTNTLTAINAK